MGSGIEFSCDSLLLCLTTGTLLSAIADGLEVIGAGGICGDIFGPHAAVAIWSGSSLDLMLILSLTMPVPTPGYFLRYFDCCDFSSLPYRWKNLAPRFPAALSRL